VTEWGRQVHSGCGNSENSELPTSGSTPTICRSSPSSAFASLLAHHLSRSLQHPACRSLFALLHVHMPARARARTPTIAPRLFLHAGCFLPCSIDQISSDLLSLSLALSLTFSL